MELFDKLFRGKVENEKEKEQSTHRELKPAHSYPKSHDSSSSRHICAFCGKQIIGSPKVKDHRWWCGECSGTMKIRDMMSFEEGRIWSPYHKWSVLSSGDGGGKIAASLFCINFDEAIGDRVLLINTDRYDLERTIKEYVMQTGAEEERAKSRLDIIRMEHIESFGPPTESGNLWKDGENAAKHDFEKEELIRRRVETLQLGSGDAIFEITTLGGGTGCGSIPFIIDKMKGGRLGPLAEHKHFAVAAWPELQESNLGHFNAICGLSRLLKFGEDAHQNADLVLLMDNTLLADMIPRVNEQSEKYFEMNTIIAEVMKLMMAPGSGCSFRILTPSDYTNAPSAIGVYHVTPCISLNNDIERVNLETALHNAIDNPLFPIEQSTSTIGWFIIRVPKKYYNKGNFEYIRLNEILKSLWKHL